MVVAEREARPFLKWAGGKKQILPELASLYPPAFRRYHEPFLGSGAVFFDLRRKFDFKGAFLSDSNAELINAYEVVRDDVNGLIELLHLHKRRHHHNLPQYYYSLRDALPATLSPLKRAARFIYLNKTCYNGLYRVNSNGHFNVPVGAYKEPQICNAEALFATSPALRGAKLRAADFDDSLKAARCDDFVYLDPPYAPLSCTSNFTGYTNSGFGEDQQERLAESFRRLDALGCYVMLSNSATPVVRRLYRGYRIRTVRARRVINSRSNGRGKISELVIVNY
jgi:DNA adenine methylase